MGLVTKTTGSLSGVQWGFVGTVDGNSEGWQSNFVSITNGASRTPDRIVCLLRQMHGLQIGLVNSAGTMKGSSSACSTSSPKGMDVVLPHHQLGRL